MTVDRAAIMRGINTEGTVELLGSGTSECSTSIRHDARLGRRRAAIGQNHVNRRSKHDSLLLGANVTAQRVFAQSEGDRVAVFNTQGHNIASPSGGIGRRDFERRRRRGGVMGSDVMTHIERLTLQGVRFTSIPAAWAISCPRRQATGR